MSLGKTNQTELIALLIVQGKDFVDGIENVYKKIKGSCSMLILTEDGIIVARDKWGRTPIVIGKKTVLMQLPANQAVCPIWITKSTVM